MPAVSKQQQKFFGVVKAMQSGDIPKKGEAGKVAKDMSKKDVDDYASTKHKGLPKKVKQETMKASRLKEIVFEELDKILREETITMKEFTSMVKEEVKQFKGSVNEALPKFKTPFEAYSWIMNKRGEAMDIETEMLNTSAEIQDKYKDMEQEAEPGGGPIQARYAKEIEALELQHKNLRTQFAELMDEIDEYDQNY